MRLRVRELETANAELQALLAASGAASASSSGRPGGDDGSASASGIATGFVLDTGNLSQQGCKVCPNCDRLVPEANFDAHVMHCERHFRRCPVCKEAMPTKDLDQHLARWKSPEGAASAASRGDLQLLRAFCAHGAALQAARSEESGGTLLHIATRQANPEMLALLLSRAVGDTGGRFEWLAAWDSKGQAALHAAVALGHEAVVALLLEAGANVDQRSRAGDTPLLVACRGGNVALVRRLESAGADLTAKTALGDTALQVAQAHGHIDCGLALGAHRFRGDLKAGAALEAENLSRARTPLRAVRKLESFGIPGGRCSSAPRQ